MSASASLRRNSSGSGVKTQEQETGRKGLSKTRKKLGSLFMGHSSNQ